MIISKTPYRVSLFGGGTDHSSYFKKNYGITIGGSINKYLYISLRELPIFFKHKYRISWSKIENVKSIERIKHPIVREVLKYFRIKEGLEIHYDGDLPGNSGTGSSASFCVGLINCINIFKNLNLSKKKIALIAYHIEKNCLKESTGLQDHIYASYGSFGKIKFIKNNFYIKSFKKNKYISKIEDNLILLYTNKKRQAHKIENKKFKKITKNKFLLLDRIKKIALTAEKNLLKKNNSIEIGNLLHESWILKKSLSKDVSNKWMDKCYNNALKCGAIGGKLIGAGGGGFFLFYVNKNKQKNFLKKMKNFTHVKFKFTNTGSTILQK